jgi:hypothetical protein
MSKGAYYQGLLSQQGIATTGPDFGQISDKFTEKILAVKANQAAADKIAYQQLKDAADAKNAFLKEQREIGSKLFNRDKFDGTGIGDFDAMAEKAKASVSAEFEGNNAMVDYIGQDAVRAKNNNIVKGYSDFLGVIQGAQEFMKNKADLDSRGLSSYTDDLKINYLAELSKNAKFDIDANGTVYITTIGEDGETLRSVPLSEVKAMLYNDIGANVDDITSDILKKQEKGKKVFQVGTTEYTKYISGGQTELSKEATDLVRTATAGLSYPQKIDALSELQRSGQSFIVSQQEYDQMNEQERKDKVVVGIEDVFKKDKEAQVDRLLEMGLSNKIFNELKVMESQEQVDPAGADKKQAAITMAPTRATQSPVNQDEPYDVAAIIKTMGNAAGSIVEDVSAKETDPNKPKGADYVTVKAGDAEVQRLNPDLFVKGQLNKNAEISAVSVPLKMSAETLKSIGVKSSSKNPWVNINGFVVVRNKDEKGKVIMDESGKSPRVSIRLQGSVSSKKITTKKSSLDKNFLEQTQSEDVNIDLSPPLSEPQLTVAWPAALNLNPELRKTFEMILTKNKQNDATFSESDPRDFKQAVVETIEYFKGK